VVTHQVLELLEKHNLYLQLDKCEFKKTMVEYLGVIISHNSIVMDPVKVARVAEWPTPTNKKEVQSFLGFTDFYQQFIKDFSDMLAPSLTSPGMTPNGVGELTNNPPLISSNGMSHWPWSSSHPT